MIQSKIYLDYAAATPIDPDVLKAMQPFFSQQFYNPSANYSEALAVRKALELSRSRVAHWLGARSNEMIFTAGGTEANNIAIHGAMKQFPNGNIVISSIEHESVLAPAQKYDLRKVCVDTKGRINLDDLVKKIDANTVLVSVMYANNEIGTIQPIREVSQIVTKKRKDRNQDSPLYFHTDACQAANYLDMHVARLGVDLMTINGGKLYGPKQSGCLYVKSGIKLASFIDGGGQERGLRSGTENVGACVGFSVAFDAAQTNRHVEVKRLQQLQLGFVDLLQKAIPNIRINGSNKFRLPNNVHVSIPGQDNERLLIQLDERGVLAAAGSACSASNKDPSHVLSAIGVSESDAQASLRFTMGKQTDENSINKTVNLLQQLVNI